MANERDMTLDDLAAIVSRGFDDLQGQISGLRVDVSGLQREVTGLQRGVTGLRGEVTGLRDGVAKRFDRVERDLSEVKYLLTDVVRRDEFLELKQRMDVVERYVGLKPKDGA